jgi:hypothetical protein
MAKSDFGFDPRAYAPVAERIRLFWESFPNGRITTRLVSRTEHDVVFVARVYRTAGDTKPAATGWAAEREGDGDVNAVACLENTETSAVGRALANLGFTAAKERPSAEEMQKAARVRARLQRTAGAPGTTRADPGRQRHSDAVADALALVRSAERLGLRPARAAAFRTRLGATNPPVDVVRSATRVLRSWVDKRRSELLAPFPE